MDQWANILSDDYINEVWELQQVPNIVEYCTSKGIPMGIAIKLKEYVEMTQLEGWEQHRMHEEDDGNILYFG